MSSFARARRLLGERPRLRRALPLLTVLGVALLVWGLTLVDLGKKRRTQSSFLPALTTSRWIGLRATSSSQFLTATDATVPVGPWAIKRLGRLLIVSAAAGRGDEYRTVYRARIEAGQPPQALDIDRWGPRGVPALFSMRQTRNQVRVTVYRLGAKPGPVFRGAAPLPRSGADRRYLIGTYSGPTPDLLVIDGGRPWVMRIYSGESGFRRLFEQVRLPERVGPRLDAWWLDLRRVPGGPPDLVLVSHNTETATGKTEVHVLTGATAFQGFSTETATPIPQRPGPHHRWLYQQQGDAGDLLDLNLSKGGVAITAVPLN